MAFTLEGKEINTVGIVGSGQIGPDIALHFAETLAAQGAKIIVVDIAQAALDSGQQKIQKKIDKQVSSGKLKADVAQALLECISFTTDYNALSACGWVIEAATEDLGIKQKIFSQLEQVVAADVLLTSNSSHLEPEVIFSNTKHPQRCAVTHYFFPAERNPVVEVVPGQKTAAATTRWLMRAYELLGKLPVQVKSRYGYALDPIFEGLFLAAAIAVERGLGTCEQVDTVCQKVLGQGVGPFTAMNLTGGNPLTNVGLTHYHDKICAFFHSPQLLKKQLENKAPWPQPPRDQAVDIAPEQLSRLADWMTGAYFALTTEVLDAGLIDVSDFDETLALALAMKPAFSWMNEIGLSKSLALVQQFAKENVGVKISATLTQMAQRNDTWPLTSVSRHDDDDVAILTIRRFKVLNALNDRVIGELDRHIDAIANDKTIRAVVIRGFGTKAFVSGADIKELAALKTSQEGINTARRGQIVFRKIEQLTKPVVIAMNGLAFGGGNELAMSGHVRLAAVGQKFFVGQPEPKLGIIPGYGGTQRLVRLIGFETAWRLLRTGETISSKQALECGLIDKEVSLAELLPQAIDLARQIAAGTVQIKPIEQGPLQVPSSPSEVDIGPLSRRIDEIMQRVIIEGAKTTLDQGLVLEANGFGDCLQTEDLRIGMENFLKNGPKVAATFVHR